MQEEHCLSGFAFLKGMILCCFCGDVDCLLLWESAASEVVHVSHEFLTLRFQTSAKGFSESFWGHYHQASKGNSHIQVRDCLCHVCFASDLFSCRCGDLHPRGYL